jgi:hypothetical protein
MARFNHSICVQLQSPSADGVYVHDLAVNPLSVVLLNLRPLNDTGTLANFNSYLSICDSVNKISVYHRGEVVASMKGTDLAALNYFRHGIMPNQAMHLDTNNDLRSVVLPLFLGRFPYDRKSCFPASRRGELTIELDLDIADTGYDALKYSIETIELLDAKPSEYERKTALNQTFAATGDQDVELNPGLINRGLLLWGTTAYAGATPVPSWGRIKLMLDNQEAAYQSTDWETTVMLQSLWGRFPPTFDAHKHRITTDGNAQTELATLAGPYNIGTLWQNYSFLDLDPTRDDEFSLDTKGKNRFNLRPNVETADAVRVVQIEKVPV